MEFLFLYLKTFLCFFFYFPYYLVEFCINFSPFCIMISNIKKVWATEHIRKKILFTIGMIAVYQLLSNIPVPGVNVALLEAYTTQLRSNTQLAFFGSVMGGGLEHFSIILMGLAPYINATIIIQLLAVIIPSLEALKKE